MKKMKKVALPQARAKGNDQIAEHIKRECQLFHTADMVAYATFPVAGHHETAAIRSAAFGAWVRRFFFQRTHRPATDHFVQGVLDLLEARALYEGPQEPVFIRIGHVGRDKLYIDLCDDQWRVVEVSTDGWRVLSKSPVAFRRARGMRALPAPGRDGDILVLKHFLNLATKQDWVLAIGWLIGAFMPKGPYAMLLLQGEHGTAKSTNARVLRALVDPNLSDLRAQPRNEQDLMIAGTNSWVLAYDNLSGIRNDLADSLCRVSTGGGLGARKLYTDGEEHIFQVSRPVMLTGIDALATREDLADRCVLLNLPPIADKHRRNEADFWEDFNGAAGVIFGGILDVLVSVLSNLGSVRMDSLMRMADFQLWVTAAEAALNWKPGTFSAAYEANRETMIRDSAENDALINEIARLLERETGKWKGTPAELLAELNEHAPDHTKREFAWPKSATWLMNGIHRRATALRSVDIHFEENRSNGKRVVRLLTSADDER